MKKKTATNRISVLLKENKKEIISIYLFSILSGLVNLSLPLGVQAIIGFVLGATMVSSIYLLISLVVVGVFLVGLFQINQMKIIETIQQKIFTNYAYEFAEKLPKLDLKLTDKYFIPEKVNRFFDTVTIQKGFAKLLLDIPIATVQILLGVVLLSLYHPLFIILGVILLSLLGLILKYTSQKGIETSMEESNYKYEVVGFFGEIARTLKSFKFSQGSHLNLIKTDKNTTGYLRARTNHFHILLFQYKSLVFFKISLTILMLTLGTYLLINQQLNIGEFIAAEIVILMVISAVEKLIISLDTAYDVITGLEKIATITEAPLESSGNLIRKNDKPFEIELSNFSFQFEANKKLLDSISLHIMPGQIVGVYGEEGSGKSLFIRMLTGNYHDFQGALLFDHIPIQNFDLASLRKQTGVLLHGQEIFGGTLWENISLGQTDLTPQVIMDTAKKLGFEDIFGHFPLGFDTIIEPIGKKTPQTIIKKILLLRALVGQNKLLLLEEPWGGLDLRSQEKVKTFLLHPEQPITTIIVSNDATFNALTDQQITFKNGTI